MSLAIGEMSKTLYIPQETIPVIGSELGILSINLETQDIYSLRTLRELMEERWSCDLDFFVCGVKEGNHIYFFEASHFLEQFIKSKGSMLNPFNRTAIGDFEIFGAPKKAQFKSHLVRQPTVESPHYLLILVQDPARSDAQLGYFFDQLGFHYEKVEKDSSKAIFYYEKALSFGFKKSQKALATLYMRTGQETLGLSLFKEFLEQERVSPSDLIFSALEISERDPAEAFQCFRRAAMLGNFVAIANLISYYEEGKGIDQDRVCAERWRALLPLEWQGEPMQNFITHLLDIQYDVKSVMSVSVPSELN